MGTPDGINVAISDLDTARREHEIRSFDAPVRMLREPRALSTLTGGQIVHRVTPLYPEPARTQGTQGAVVLEAMVGEDAQ